MRVALVWHGSREDRNSLALADHRLGPTAEAMREAGLSPEAAVYNDDFADEVKQQLMDVSAVLVWVNPMEGGRDRSKLDAMLEDISDAGVLVSAHPAAIRKMGTKEVLYRTKHMSWGSDVHLYSSAEELREQLPIRLSEGARVLKRLKGHSGNGVWKIAVGSAPDRVLVRHAARGAVEEEQELSNFLAACLELFPRGPIIDQPYQERIGDGMVRCYMVEDKVAGFGHQEINALFPGANPPQPGPRLYHGADKPEFQGIRERMATEWVAGLLSSVGLTRDELPLLWDADLMFGATEGSYVLCEINVSSVFPYPDSARLPLAEALRERLYNRG